MTSHSDEEDDDDEAAVDNKTEIDSEYDFSEASECEDLEDRLKFCRNFLAKYDNYIPTKVEKKIIKTYDCGYEPYKMNYVLSDYDKDYFKQDLIYRISDHIAEFVTKNSDAFVKSSPHHSYHYDHLRRYEVTIPSFVEYEKEQKRYMTKSRYSIDSYDYGFKAPRWEMRDIVS